MQLGPWLKTNSINAVEFGRRIGLKEPNSIYRYIQGTRRPATRMIEAIFKETNGAVTPNDFFDIAEEAAEPPEDAI